MTPELRYLGLVCLMTALMWLPYTLDLLVRQGLMTAFGNRDDARPMSAWADRAKRAHVNAIENLVVFAALILALHAAGVSSAITTTAAIVYFWTRLAHYIVYTLGIVVVRTLVWSAGWVCLLVLAWQLVAAA